MSDRPKLIITPTDLNVDQRLVYLYGQIKKLKSGTASTTPTGGRPAVPAPQVTQGLTATTAGVGFAFQQQSGVDGYKVYRNSTNAFAGSTPINYIRSSPSLASVTVNDVTPNGSTYYYWITAVDTAGVESSPVAVQAVATSSGNPINSQSRLTGSLYNNQINVSSVPVASSTLSNSGTATAVTIAGWTNKYDPTVGSLAYNSGSVDLGSYGKQYVFVDDPTYLGGAPGAYIVSTDPTVAVANVGRLPVGKITTTSGTASSGGGNIGGGGRGYLV